MLENAEAALHPLLLYRSDDHAFYYYRVLRIDRIDPQIANRLSGTLRTQEEVVIPRIFVEGKVDLHRLLFAPCLTRLGSPKEL